MRLYPTDENELVTSEDVIKETLTVVSQRMGKIASIDACQKILADYTILPVSHERFQAGLALFLNPKVQKDVSLIDCITVAICKELKTKKILTFDRHFKFFGLRPLP